jgi:hypothetical protein
MKIFGDNLVWNGADDKSLGCELIDGRIQNTTQIVDVAVFIKQPKN